MRVGVRGEPGGGHRSPPRAPSPAPCLPRAVLYPLLESIYGYIQTHRWRGGHRWREGGAELPTCGRISPAGSQYKIPAVGGALMCAACYPPPPPPPPPPRGGGGGKATPLGGKSQGGNRGRPRGPPLSPPPPPPPFPTNGWVRIRIRWEWGYGGLSTKFVGQGVRWARGG